MKNHWIQLYEKKKKKIWTSEFSKNGLFSLKARRVDVIDSSMSSGSVSIIFKDAMYSFTMCFRQRIDEFFGGSTS